MACAIVQISDLHFAPCFERRFFEAVVDACLDWRADLVVMTGDLVEDDDTSPGSSRSWAPSRPGWASSRSWATTTRHINRGMIAGELGRAGFEMLEGRWTTLDVDGDGPGDRRNVRTLGTGL